MKKKSERKYIKIRGANEHNLKNIDVDIPRDEFVVLTGLSGSGKSSLAFDTIYAEGQRRYMESLSSYARQFLGRWKSRMWRRSRDCPRRSPLTRSPRTAIQDLPLVRLRRFMIISAFCTRESVSHIVRNVAGRSKNRR